MCLFRMFRLQALQLAFSEQSHENTNGLGRVY